MKVNSSDVKRFEEHVKKIRETVSLIYTSESAADKAKRIKRLLKNNNEFVQYYFPHYTEDARKNRHVDIADFHDDWMSEVSRNPNFFGVAEWPREHAKSVVNCIFIPMKLIATKQLDGLVLGGKSETAAIRLLSDVQAELQFNQRFINDFGLQYQSGTWEKGEFTTKGGEYFIAIGRGQTPRGIRKGSKRPNVGILDDIDDDEMVQNPSRIDETMKWIRGAFLGMLDIRQSRFLMGGNRIHPQSLLAHMVGDIDENTPKNKAVYHSKVVATKDGTLTGEPTWHQKFTREELARKFEQMGYYMALREFFHKAIIVGKVFKQEWIHYDKIPPLKQMDWIIYYFDPSYKPKTTNDFKAIRVWGKLGTKLYLIKSFVRQCSITTCVKWMYDEYEYLLKKDISAEFVMEDLFLQDQFYEDFDAEAELRGKYLPIRGDKRDKPDKYVRIVNTAPLYERGMVIYNEAEKKSPDMRIGEQQVLGFEKGSGVHDDAPDADEGAIYILQKRGRVSKSKPIIGMRNNDITDW